MTETRGGEEEGDWTVDAHAAAMAAAIRAANLPVFAEGGEVCGSLDYHEWQDSEG